MFIALGLTFLGMALGFLLRGPALDYLADTLRHTRHHAAAFCAGHICGQQRAAHTVPARLGGAALALTVAGILGSLACAALIRRFFTKTPTPAGISPQQKATDAEARSHEG